LLKAFSLNVLALTKHLFYKKLNQQLLLSRAQFRLNIQLLEHPDHWLKDWLCQLLLCQLDKNNQTIWYLEQNSKIWFKSLMRIKLTQTWWTKTKWIKFHQLEFKISFKVSEITVLHLLFNKRHSFRKSCSISSKKIHQNCSKTMM
jgi:hypothetical protein